MTQTIAAIDQGTTSTRCMIFDRDANVVSVAQQEHEQIYPRPGWVEHDPVEIWQATQQVVRDAVKQIDASSIAAVGITNQRETLVVWDRRTGEPYHNAIVWQDTRTKSICDELAKDGGADRFRGQTGLPLATYFSGPKLRWLLDHVDGLRDDAAAGHAICGTIDAWLVWRLTGRHVTDVTNASRTMLMDLRTLDWDDALLDAFGVPRAMLPEVAPSSDAQAFGETRDDGPFGRAVPVAGVLGDQQAALFGQCCFDYGDAKNTYGTGCFLLFNTGGEAIQSQHGLLTTLAYQRSGDKPAYALEGSIAITGALVQWMRDNMHMIERSEQIEDLARQVEDSAGIYFVPAFSGLFAPHWRSDARGVIVGLTRFVNRYHLARAALEATAYQTREVIDAMQRDAGMAIKTLKVDGGMVANELLMQFQADVLDPPIPVARSSMAETTALGAAFAAGLAAGVFKDIDALRDRWRSDRTWRSQIDAAQRDTMVAGWKKAVQRSLDWV